MTLPRVLIFVAVLVAVGLFSWQFRRASHRAPDTSAPAVLMPPPAPPPSVTQPKIENPKSKIAPLERLNLASALNAPAADIRADLRLVADVLDTFRTNFPQGGNPVGSNAEITATLTGANRLRVAFLAPDHPAINRDGELCDRWGTPFFFHAESAQKMEIRSAGPDRKMWNDDDVTFTP
ncbi:MAG: hypothetical protein JNL39_15975 [Opitutaceae bacterium]|nr:hypothetical protein [Opitutaceae bacterium]